MDRLRGDEPVAQRFGLAFVLGLCGRKVAQQLADPGIGGVARGLGIEHARFGLHDLGLGAELLQIDGLHQPQRFALDEAAHVLTADQRNAVTEPRAVDLDQTVTMGVFFGRHAAKELRGVREVSHQRIGILAVDAGVVFFERYRQRQQLLLGQLGKLQRGRAARQARHGE
ncbi:hypothetical protein GALL_456330 [mine drainage metagenome]|uniref:Uncharacterized protein n=1 Tax=mine drainage metagenome TaxID=410659 RepID=A0A1J5PYS9_9ZZZZ